MEVSVSISPGTKSMIEQFRNQYKTLNRGVFAGMRRAAKLLESDVILHTTSVLGTRSGKLRDSIKGDARRPTEGQNVAVISIGSQKGSASAYSRFQEFGGTVVPKRSKWLTIPQKPHAVYPSGVPKFTEARKATAPLKFVPLKNRGKPLALLVNANRKSEVWYVLVKQVTVPPSKWLSDGVNKNLHKVAPRIERGLAEHLKRAL